MSYNNFDGVASAERMVLRLLKVTTKLDQNIFKTCLNTVKHPLVNNKTTKPKQD